MKRKSVFLPEMQSIPILTEEQGNMLSKVADAFWYDLGRITAKHLNRVPHELQDYALMLFQDKASVYGSDFTKHMKRPPPFVERFNKVLGRKP